EDGIRDRNVTGVQTCALPILDKNSYWINILSSSYFFNQTSTNLTHALTSATPPSFQLSHLHHKIKIAPGLPQFSLVFPPHSTLRSEERRVGKECNFVLSRDA